MRRLALFVVLALVLLAACSPSVAQAPTPTAEPPTATATVAPTSTATATPTITPTPTETPLPSPTPLSDAFLSGEAAQVEYTAYLLEQMALAREAGEETFMSYTPHGHEVEFDVVPAEVAEQFDWDWGVMGFVKEEEGKTYAYRHWYQDVEGEEGEPPYQTAHGWREYRAITVNVDGLDVTWTIESPDFEAIQTPGGLTVMQGMFTEKAADKIALATSLVWGDRDRYSSIIVPHFQSLVAYYTEMGAPKADYFVLDAFREVGVTVVLVDEMDDTMAQFQSYYFSGGTPDEGWKIEVRNGRPCIYLYRSAWDAWDKDVLNHHLIGYLLLIKQEYEFPDYFERVRVNTHQHPFVRWQGVPNEYLDELDQVYEQVTGTKSGLTPTSELIFH